MNNSKRGRHSPSDSEDSDKMSTSGSDTDNDAACARAKSSRKSRSQTGQIYEPLWPDMSIKTRIEEWKAKILNNKRYNNFTEVELALNFYESVPHDLRNENPKSWHVINEENQAIKKWIWYNVIQATHSEIQQRLCEERMQALRLQRQAAAATKKGGKTRKTCKRQLSRRRTRKFSSRKWKSNV